MAESTPNYVDVDLTAIGSLRARIMAARAKRLKRPISDLIETEALNFHISQEAREAREIKGDQLIGGEELVSFIESRKADA